MAYFSSLTDKEWERLEPLLLEVLPPKKQTRPSNWTKREIIDGVLYQLKNGCSWGDLPKDLPPYSIYRVHTSLISFVLSYLDPQNPTILEDFR